MKNGNKAQFRHRMQCGVKKCRQRFALKRHPSEYKRPPKCPACGSTSVHSIEKFRQDELAKQDTCNCYGIPFPHRKGSIMGCEHHPKPREEWTQEDEYYYQAMLETPRGF